MASHVILDDARLIEVADRIRHQRVNELLDRFRMPENIGELRGQLDAAYQAGFSRGVEFTACRVREWLPREEAE